MGGILTWPAALSHRPILAGYGWRPHDPQPRIEMEQGPARKRRAWVASPSYISAVWPFSLAEFELFRAWHHTALEDGAAWFRMPVFTGEDFEPCICRFRGVYQPELSGLVWMVSAEVEVRGAAFISPLDAPEAALRVWPASIEPLPLRDGATMTPHRPVIRTDIERGPAAARRWFEDGPVTPQFTWVMPPDAFVLFRSWYHHALRDGAAWFTMPAWVGGWHGTRRCRFYDAWEAALQPDGAWRVSASLEIRDVPYMDDAAVFLIGVLGEPSFTGLSTGIHHFIHVSYPEATA
jgi:hypothetical protein